MPWYDDARQYYDYAITSDIAISQGDIVIAATAVIAPGLGEAGVAGPHDLGEMRKITLWRPVSDEMPAAPALSAEVRWGLAMVVPHPCAMEKEWNERVEELIASGIAQDEAERQSTANEGLDPFIAVAPVLPYDAIAISRRTSIAAGNRLGFFPVCADNEIPASYIDFNQITTLREELVRVPRRVRALSVKARAKLQLSLSQFFAWRAKSKIGEIEAAIGKSIDDVTCITKGGKVIATFLLDDGTTLALEGSSRAEPAGPAPERPART